MPFTDPELDDDEGDAAEEPTDHVPNTPDAHPGVDDGFFGPAPKPADDDDDDGGGMFPLDPRIGDDPPDVEHGKSPPVIVTSRRPSISRDFPAYNPNVVSYIRQRIECFILSNIFCFKYAVHK